MGQLITKLMGIFGKQGKGSQSIQETALIWIPSGTPWIWGHPGGSAGGPQADLRGSCVDASRLVQSPLCPPCPLLTGRASVRPRAQSWASLFPLGKRHRWFSAIVTSGSALSPDPFCWQAQSPPDPSDNHFSGNVEREKWSSVLISTVLGQVGKKAGLFFLGGWGGR